MQKLPRLTTQLGLLRPKVRRGFFEQPIYTSKHCCYSTQLPTPAGQSPSPNPGPSSSSSSQGLPVRQWATPLAKTIAQAIEVRIPSHPPFLSR